MPAKILSPQAKRRRQAERESDVVNRRYVRPIGTRGLSRVEIPGTGVTKAVANASGMTFEPGTMVPVARNLDSPGETIIGRPPPGQRGARPVVRRSVSVGEAITFGFTADGYAWSGDMLRAWEFESGSPYSAGVMRGEIEIVGGIALASSIVALSGLGTHALAFVIGNGDLPTEQRVWDVEGSTLYERSVTAERAASAPQVAGEYLWWVEFDQHTEGGGQTARLYRSGHDFSGATQIQTVAISAELASQAWESITWQGVSDSAAWVEVTWNDDVNFEVSGSERIRIPLDGSAGDHAAEATIYAPAGPAIALPGGGIGAAEGSLGAAVMTDALGGEWEELWPTGWALTGGVSIAVTVDGSIALYSQGDDTRITRAAEPFGETPGSSELVSGDAPALAFGR